MTDGPPRPSPDRAPDEDPEEDSFIFQYAVPFVGAVLLALGIAGGVVGGWALLQPAIGGCGNPVIGVDSPEMTQAMIADSGDGTAVVETIAFEDLSPAEQRAFEEGIEDVEGDGTVRGEFPNRDAFERGVVVSHEGTERYATLVTMDRCTSIDPLVFPLGVTSMLLGFGVFGFMWFRNTELSESLRERRGL